MEYEDYISSKEWKARADFLKFSTFYTCQLCLQQFAAKLHVHHISYDHLGEERPWEVIVLCSFCHEMVHDPIHGELYRRYVEIYAKYILAHYTFLENFLLTTVKNSDMLSSYGLYYQDYFVFARPGLQQINKICRQRYMVQK